MRSDTRRKAESTDVPLEALPEPLPCKWPAPCGHDTDSAVPATTPDVNVPDTPASPRAPPILSGRHAPAIPCPERARGPPPNRVLRFGVRQVPRREVLLHRGARASLDPARGAARNRPSLPGAAAHQSGRAAVATSRRPAVPEVTSPGSPESSRLVRGSQTAPAPLPRTWHDSAASGLCRQADPRRPEGAATSRARGASLRPSRDSSSAGRDPAHIH